MDSLMNHELLLELFSKNPYFEKISGGMNLNHNLLENLRRNQ